MFILNSLHETIDLNLSSYLDRSKTPILFDSHPINLPRGNFYSGSIRFWVTEDFSVDIADCVVNQVYKHIKEILEFSYDIHDSYVDFNYRMRESESKEEN